MKTAICYYSRHHGNTLKVLEAMAQEGEIALIDVTTRQTIDLEGCDCIGFASGIYYGKFHDSVINFARQYLPKGKNVFFVCTCGGGVAKKPEELEALAVGRSSTVLGTFRCKGYDTFGPFKLVGGIAKGHPDKQDLENARRFYQEITMMMAETGDKKLRVEKIVIPHEVK